MQKEQKKDKKRGKIVFLYYAIIIILIIEGYTFAKYISVGTADAKIDAASFQFKISEGSQDVELNLSDTLTANAYSEDEIIPGTCGKITLTLDFSNIETATNYTIELNEGSTVIPDNLTLYSDADYSVKFTGYSGTTELGATTLERTIYWEWDYVTEDESDEWMGKDITVALTITAEQRTN